MFSYVFLYCGCLVPTIMQLWFEDEHLLIFKIGLDRRELDFVWSIIRHKMGEHYDQHHHARKPPILPVTSLLLTLYWMRYYPSHRCMATEFGVNECAIRESIDHCIDTLFTTLVPTCFSDTAIPHRGYRKASVAGVRLVVDSTFLPLPQNSDTAERKRYYHYKSPTKKALKWQLCVTTEGIPWHISNVVEGSKADVTLLRESGIMNHLPPDTRVLGDKGYVGVPKLTTPKNKPRGRELNREEIKQNKVKHRKRAVVENCIHEFKKWRILDDEYRGEFREQSDIERIKRIVHVVGGIVKRHLIHHPLRTYPAATV